MTQFDGIALALAVSHPSTDDVSPVALILFWIATSTWLVALIVGFVAGLWLLWRRRAMRKWIAAFDRGLEREERARALMRSRS
ncbi:hypothetical protein ACOTCL_29090 [Achromobacter xylosoxidans]